MVIILFHFCIILFFFRNANESNKNEILRYFRRHNFPISSVFKTKLYDIFMVILFTDDQLTIQ